MKKGSAGLGMVFFAGALLVGPAQGAVKPRISVEAGTVAFRNARGKLVKRIPLVSESGGSASSDPAVENRVQKQDAAFLSPGRNYAAVVTFPSVPRANGAEGLASVRFYDGTGTSLWQAEGLSEVDPLRFSDDGKTVLLVCRNEGRETGVRAVARETQTGKVLFRSEPRAQIHELTLSPNGRYGRFHARDAAFRQTQVIFGVAPAREKALDLDEEIYVLPEDDGVFRYFVFQRDAAFSRSFSYTVKEIRLD
ncbi:MAG: hypothetical protein IPP35_05505 [Elusimicrobia bacterium]|nr:hypothetical protein [Elusimicrobiota bacterium]